MRRQSGFTLLDDPSVTGPRFTPDTLRPTPEQLAIQTATDKYIVVEANAGSV